MILDIIVLAVWALACLVCVLYEVSWGAFWVTAIASVIGAIFLGFNVFTWVWANPTLALQYAALYACVGLVWSTFKFWRKLRKAQASYLKDKAEWLAREPRIGVVSQTPEAKRTEEDWLRYVKDSYGMREQYAPTVAANKNKILFWAWHWPFSMIAFLFEDLVQAMWNTSWKMIKSIMEGIRKASLGQAAKDLD